MTTIKEFANKISEEFLRGITPPPPDPFDVEKYPCGTKAGTSKFGNITCPTCGKPATHPTQEEYPWESAPPAEGFFMFRDKGSAREYLISGMCQSCQDLVFGDAK